MAEFIYLQTLIYAVYAYIQRTCKSNSVMPISRTPRLTHNHCHATTVQQKVNNVQPLYGYSYGCNKAMFTGVLQQWLSVYHSSDYGHIAATATGVSYSQQVYHIANRYGQTTAVITATATGLLQAHETVVQHLCNGSRLSFQTDFLFADQQLFRAVLP